MRLDVMRYFLAVADEKSISKVSRKYNIPQQSLSSMMQAFANEIGMPLFEQSGYGLVMTEAGREVYQYCAAFMNDYAVLKKKLYPKAEDERQTIAIISQNSIAQTVLSRWVSTLYKYDSNLNLKIEIGTSAKVLSAVQENEAQIGFIILFEKGTSVYPVLPDDIVFHPIHVSKPYFWMNEKHELAQQKAISMQSLKNYPLIKDSQVDNEVADYIYQEIFQMNNQEIMAPNVHIILQLVRDNIAICPDIKMEQGELGYAYLFAQYADIKALPLNGKDNYKLITGYITKKDAAQNNELAAILKHL